MVKDFLQHENSDIVMPQETKREVCDMIIWDSKKLSNEEVVIGSLFCLSQVFYGRNRVPLALLCLWS